MVNKPLDIDGEELVTILKNADPSAMALMEALLAEAGIMYNVKGKEVSSIAGVHGMTGGFEPISLLTGSPAIQVERKNLDKALELLNHLYE